MRGKGCRGSLRWELARVRYETDDGEENVGRERHAHYISVDPTGCPELSVEELAGRIEPSQVGCCAHAFGLGAERQVRYMHGGQE